MSLAPPPLLPQLKSERPASFPHTLELPFTARVPFLVLLLKLFMFAEPSQVAPYKPAMGIVTQEDFQIPNHKKQNT